jgi:hypothetical protein
MELQLQIKSFEDLVKFVENWRSWSGGGQYDFGGMTSLLGACLDNLRNYALDAELEELAGFLEPDQIRFLQALASRLHGDPERPEDPDRG